MPIQPYPRLSDSDLLDDSKLLSHTDKIPSSKLKEIVINAIETAEKKSSRAILNLPNEATEEQVQRIYQKEGRELFNYFRKYFDDPASTAYHCLHRHCYDVAREQFRNRALQKQRMNSAWRYQYIAKDTAVASKRFENVADIGLKEADFVAVIQYNTSDSKLSIYVSVKNRANTMGGQDWPKAIEALENVARFDKNRDGDYICVFGISMEKGSRNIKHSQKTKAPYSVNTELWYSDFFWPFFSNHTYEEIIKAVLEILMKIKVEEATKAVEIPQELFESFEARCSDYELLDEHGYFNDAFKLVELFCGKSSAKKKSSSG